MQPSLLDFFAKFVQREAGILFHETNLYQLQTRIEEIVKKEGLGSPEALMQKFQSPGMCGGLKQRFIDHATNNETLFFRDPTFFTAVGEFLQKEFSKKMPSELKIWSAAASTGQEALSVAMTLDELSAKIPMPAFSITATDISEKALTKCRSGLYSDFEVGRGLSEERKQRYFTKEADGWRVKPSLHSKVKYSYNNLISSTVNDRFHLILCRNVLIYQEVSVKRKVIDSLYQQLDPNGGILLGVGETLLGIKDQIQTTSIGNVIFYKNAKISNAA